MTDAAISNAVASLLSVPRDERWKLAVRGACRRVSEELVATMTKRLPPGGPPAFDWDACMNGTGDPEPNEARNLTDAELEKILVACRRHSEPVPDYPTPPPLPKGKFLGTFLGYPMYEAPAGSFGDDAEARRLLSAIYPGAKIE